MRLFLKFLILKCFLVLFLFNSAWAANTSYYIDATNGLDINDGLSGDNEGGNVGPWKTLGKATGLAVGSDVYLLCGETWTGERITVNWTGTGLDEADRVIIGAYWMDGSTETHAVSGNRPKITSPTDYGIYTTSAGDYVHITGIEISGSSKYGISGDYGGNDLKITNCYVHGNWNWGIRSVSSRAIIESNTLGDNSNYSDDNIPINAGDILLNKINDMVIRYNTFTGTHGEPISCIESSGHEIAHNLVGPSSSVGIYLDACQNTEVHHNLIYGTNETEWNYALGAWSHHGITINIEGGYNESATGNKIHNNIIINRMRGVEIKNDKYDQDNTKVVENNYIYNNTAIDCKIAYRFKNIDGVTNDSIDTGTNYFKNNLAYCNDASCSAISIDGSTIDNWDFGNNAYDPNYSSGNTSLKDAGTDQYGDAKIATVAWRGTDKVNNATFTIADFVIEAGSIVINNGASLGASYDDAWSPSSAIPPKKVTTIVSQNFDIGVLKVEEGQPLQPPSGLKISPN